MTIKTLLEDLKSSNKPVVKLLQKGENFRVIAIGFNKNAILDDHKTDQPAKLIVIQGKVLYKEGAKMIVMSQYDEVQIPVNVIHSVTALDNSICILIKG